MPEPGPRRVVAIHQPNFFPWLGYFDKIARSDVFVILDHVQFPKTRDSNWSNRVKVEMYGKFGWATMPLVRGYEGFRTIAEMRSDSASPWRRKMVRALHDTYRRAAAFDEVFPFVQGLVENPADNLAEYNLSAIRMLCARLGLPTDHFVRSTALDVAGGKTDLLVSIVRAVDGTTYLAGGGAAGYQDDARLNDAGIEVLYQQFQPKPYARTGTAGFEPGLSVLDAAFHCGFDGTAALLNP